MYNSSIQQCNWDITFTKVVALVMQMLDKKPADDPMTTIEETPADYETE